MYSSTDTEGAHAPVEMSTPVENETNYRAKQNMKTDQRHPQKKTRIYQTTTSMHREGWTAPHPSLGSMLDLTFMSE